MYAKNNDMPFSVQFIKINNTAASVGVSGGVTLAVTRDFEGDGQLFST